jgi:hypothetical protein
MVSNTTQINDVLNHENNNNNNYEPTQKNLELLSLPIFVRGVLDFISLKNEISNLVLPDTFVFKSSSTNLKI